MNTISIKCIKSEQIESGVCQGQFLISPLNVGQGITIGNQLRRVLLGDLEGTAISEVRIAGITHEFSSIPGVREDILEILLNLKGIVLKKKESLNEIPAGRLKVQGPSVITAGLIQLPEGLEIINANHYIGTVSTSNLIEMEFKFSSGTGYRLANQTLSNNSENYLQLDTIFMPVQNVDFKIENFSDTNNVPKERILLDICTNGSILPDEALEAASKIIINSLLLIIQNKNTSQNQKFDSHYLPMGLEPYTNIAIEELQLSVRAYNCLKKAQINTVGDLLKYSPEKLQELKNFGRKSSDEVFSTLQNKLGIILK